MSNATCEADVSEIPLLTQRADMSGPVCGIAHCLPSHVRGLENAREEAK